MQNVELSLSKNNLTLSFKCLTPLSSRVSAMDGHYIRDKVYGLQRCQEFIGVLRCAVKIGRVDILLEVSLMSSHFLST